MKALTLIQPWAQCICYLGKRVENRTWSAPQGLIGQTFAIHAGKTVDKDDLRAIEHDFGRGSMPPNMPLGAVVATARLIACITTATEFFTLEDAGKVDDEQQEWFFGPVGWVLDEVKLVIPPVYCRGAQGLWELPADIETQVIAGREQ